MYFRITLAPVSKHSSILDWQYDGSNMYGLHANNIKEAVNRAVKSEFRNRCTIQKAGVQPILRGLISIT